MSANSVGEKLRATHFGESHGSAMGVVIEGIPSGLKFDAQMLQERLNRRRPGQNPLVSQRQESDQFEILSGVYNEKFLGTPATFIVKNLGQRSEDYKEIEKNPRIGHADDTWKNKFSHVDPRGGGRASGRETLTRVIAGAVAEMLMVAVSKETKVLGYATKLGPVTRNENESVPTESKLRESVLRFPFQREKEAQELLTRAVEMGESYGGEAEVVILNPPKNLGQPVFHKLKADLAFHAMSVGATAGIEFGAGFTSSQMKGTDFHSSLLSSNYGGSRGGITTGENILYRVAFKPTSSIKDVAKKGRHDPCIVPRAVPVLESLAWFVLADHLLWSATDDMSKLLAHID